MPAIIGLPKKSRPTGVTKQVGSRDDWRVRIGQYRIVYEINDAENLMITIHTAAKRSEVYR